MEKIKRGKLSFTTRRRGWRLVAHRVRASLLFTVILTLMGLFWYFVWYIIG